MAENSEKLMQIAFAAVEKEWTKNIPTLSQEEVRGKEYIAYGDSNLYPDYLNNLYENVTTLKTVIDGTSEFIAGDDVTCTVPGFEYPNKSEDSWRNLVKWLAHDYDVYGGCAYEVIRNKMNKPVEVHYIDFRYLRTDKKNECFWYSEEYGKKWGRTSSALVYPRFTVNGTAPSSIVYIKNTVSTPYPIPRYSGAIKACEIERHIDDMHLNGLENSFMGSYIFNFLNGVPTDEQKGEIEKNVQEKFCSSSNAGRILLNFANGRDNALTLQKLETVDFSEKYQAAATRSREQIYCSFQAVPALFGLMSESTGFNEQEFEQAFRLYNRTVVRGVQRTICDSFDRVLGVKGSLNIKPFSLEDNNETNVN